MKEDVDQVRLLIAHGADASLRVGEKDRDALSWLLWKKKGRLTDLRSTGKVIKVLVEEAASLDNLEGDRVRLALVAGAAVGYQGEGGFWFGLGNAFMF